MNTHNPKVCLQLYFLWHTLRSCLLAAFASKRSLQGMGFFPDPQLTAIIIRKQVLMWEVGGIGRLGGKAVSGVIWDSGLGSFPSDLGQSTSCSVPPLFKSDPLWFVSEQLIDIGLGSLLWNNPKIPKCLCMELKFKYKVSFSPPCLPYLG